MGHRWRTAMTATLCSVVLVAGCSSNAVEDRTGPDSAPVTVDRFASTNPGSVNTYWLRAPGGLVVVDAQRSLSDARRALAAMRAAGPPVAAIVVTHPHPDHVGGLGTLHAAYPQAEMYASAESAEFIRTDPLGFYALTRELPGSDYAGTMTVPDERVRPGATLDLAGLQLETAQFRDGESVSAVVYYEPESGALFTGDLVNNEAIPALLEGHTCRWLQHLDRLRRLFPDARTVYPGHGPPGDPDQLIAAQERYLHQIRDLVHHAMRPTSPAGPTVTSGERTAVIDELDRRYPDAQPVASLPTLRTENVNSVARELRTPDVTHLPVPCRVA